MHTDANMMSAQSEIICKFNQKRSSKVFVPFLWRNLYVAMSGNFYEADTLAKVGLLYPILKALKEDSLKLISQCSYYTI